MKKFKEILENISKRIKKSNITRLLKSKSIINDLENKIKELEREKQILNDRIRKLELDLKNIEELENRISSMELVIASSDKSLKSKMKQIEELKDEKVKIHCELFETQQELARVNIQLELKEDEIKDLKSDRYLIRKIPAGRKPNTNKTKISMPMKPSVVRHLREEHEIEVE